MSATGRSRRGHHSRLNLVTAGGALLAFVPLLFSACSSAPAAPAGVQQACTEYGNRVRPTVATALAMDAKIKSGDTAGATADATAIQTALGGPGQQPFLSAGDASTDQLAFVIHAYNVWNSEWTWAKGVAAGTLGAGDVDAFEINLIGEASLADRYAAGSTGGTPVCPSLSIPSPYRPATE